MACLSGKDHGKYEACRSSCSDTGFPEAGRAAQRDFPRAKPKGNPEENAILPDYITQIYILFLIGFRIGPPKIHRRFVLAFLKPLAVPYWPS